MITTLLLSMVGAGLADDFNLSFVSSGMTAKMGGYVPVRAEMKSEATGVKKAPSSLSSPMYGTFVFGEKSFAFVLDEKADGSQALFVDSNADGDFTNDTPAKWDARKQGESTMYFGSATVKIDGQDAAVSMYRFDKNDPGRAALKNTVLYYGDFGYSGKATIGGKTYNVAMAGFPGDKARMWVDRNANGKSEGRSESVVVGSPFNFEGKSYVISYSGGKLSVGASEKQVEEIPLPPNLSVGQKVVPFDAETINGEKISFPKSYKGKVVLLDFWATWCGPCIAELPNVIKAYETHHDKGFEILGISLDQANMKDKVNAFTKERNMPWAQIYEGKFWDVSLVKRYGVEGIPFVLLVDGDTGEILADHSKLRGPQIVDTVGTALLNKSKGGK
ncbi:MAG: TlpA family protein disulfide reductase [Fimbriimonadaceae bacterium]|nr:TlpA family protein disulfide reductase [Fimbriimonadaceae bacterium]